MGFYESFYFIILLVIDYLLAHTQLPPAMIFCRLLTTSHLLCSLETLWLSQHREDGALCVWLAFK